MRVDVYKNLHKQCWSLRSKEGDTYGRVVEHATEFDLFGCYFVVGKKGRQRVLNTRQKNVHAVIRGNTDPKFLHNKKTLAYKGEVSYNPYVAGYFFITGSGKEIKSAKLVRFFKDKVLVYD